MRNITSLPNSLHEQISSKIALFLPLKYGTKYLLTGLKNVLMAIFPPFSTTHPLSLTFEPGITQNGK